MTQSSENETIPIEIGVQEVKQLMDSEIDVVLIDCREQPEIEYCGIEGALAMPMNETPNRLSELEDHREKAIVVFCHHGTRSLFVARWLRSQGFETVKNMTGGIDVWSQVIDSSIPRY